MTISVTPQAPGPFIIPANPNPIRARRACEDILAATQKYLQLGEQIGEPTLMHTYYLTAQLIVPWVASVDALAAAATENELDVTDPVFKRIHELQERGHFYLEILHEVQNNSLADQRDQIFRFILRPLFFGLHYKVYFDDETPEYTGAPFYCEPLGLSLKIESTVNIYRQLIIESLFGSPVFGSPEFWDDVSTYWADQLHDIVPWETAQAATAVWYHDEMKPAVDAAKQVSDASLEAAKEVAESLAKVARNPLPLIAAIVAGFALVLAARK